MPKTVTGNQATLNPSASGDPSELSERYEQSDQCACKANLRSQREIARSTASIAFALRWVVALTAKADAHPSSAIASFGKTAMTTRPSSHETFHRKAPALNPPTLSPPKYPQGIVEALSRCFGIP
uniref:Uncharacterized protein n=1 Tax=Coccidioides posadasii RMSCC 3488 TaxID=454284 RepID=A0A0J6FBJ2_COCPO|nr:hypothetical protein CPAG_06718 [Coccidioides posadasii RMSCC 3488]